MTPFEQELKQALARREPGEDFTAKVLAATGQSDAKRKQHTTNWGSWFLAVPTLRYLACAAVLLIVLAVGFAYRHQEKQQRGEEAKRQLMTALHIAGAQLHQAQLRVKRTQFPEVVMQ